MKGPEGIDLLIYCGTEFKCKSTTSSLKKIEVVCLKYNYS
jgi:hypothetical protein